MKEITNVTFLKPLFIVFRLTGIELDPFRKFFKEAALFSSFTSFLMFFANVWSNLYFSIYVLCSLNQYNFPGEYYPSTIPQTSTWSMLIDFASYDFMVIAVHAALLCLTRKTEWKSLMKNLANLNQETGTVTSKMKKRRIVIVGVIFLITVSYFRE